MTDEHHAGMPTELSELLAEILPRAAGSGGRGASGRGGGGFGRGGGGQCGGGFGHREHVHLAFLAVRRYGTAEAADRIGGWLRHLTVYAGAPQKYNATVTRAWTEIVGHHVAVDRAGSDRAGWGSAGSPGAAGSAGAGGAMDFDSFAARHPRLLEKRLLMGHYSSSVLACAGARAAWVEPDLVPFPWRQL